MNTKDKIDIMQAFLDGKEIESRVHHHDSWDQLAGEPSWDWVMYDYRIKPQKQLVIPWEHIKSQYEWAAMDAAGEVFVFADVPKSGGMCWWNEPYGEWASIDSINLDTDGIDWKQSLVQRPEGV